MKEHNIYRLVNASPYAEGHSRYVLEAIEDYYLMADYDIENINVDDLIVNSLTYISKNDIDSYWGGIEELEDNYYILYRDEDDGDIWILQ
jgi:hypothetical protein